MQITEYKIAKYNETLFEKFDMEIYNDIIQGLHNNIMFTFKIFGSNNQVMNFLITKDFTYIYLNYSILLFAGKDFTKLTPTNSLYTLFGNEEKKIEEAKNNIADMVMPIYKLYYIFSLNTVKKKVIPSSLYEKVKIPKYSIEYKKYEYDFDNDYFLIDQKDNQVDFIVCREANRNLYSIPSVMYPLFSKDKMSVYTSDNTCTLEDYNELSDIITPLLLKYGDCFNNTNLIMDKLREAGYDKKHKVERKVGWYSVTATDPQFHSWIVVDDKCIIDANNNLINDILKEEVDSQRNGNSEDKVYSNKKGLSRNYIVNKYKEIITLPFSERGIYGKLQDYVLYVGSTCEAGKEKEMLNSLRDKFPNHPAFNNYNKQTGNTRLQTIARHQGI